MSLEEEIYRMFVEVGVPLTTQEVRRQYPDEQSFEVTKALVHLLKIDVLVWVSSTPTKRENVLLLKLNQ